MNRLTTRAIKKMIHKYAILVNLQKVVGWDGKKRPRFLISAKAFREGGEAYSIIDGVDRQTASIRAGHSLQVQSRNYVKYDEIRAREMVDKHLKL